MIDDNIEETFKAAEAAGKTNDFEYFVFNSEDSETSTIEKVVNDEKYTQISSISNL